MSVVLKDEFSKDRVWMKEKEDRGKYCTEFEEESARRRIFDAPMRLQLLCMSAT